MRALRNVVVASGMLGLLGVSGAGPGQAQTVRELGFDTDKELESLSVTGAVAVDTAKARQGAASLRLDPGSQVEWALRSADGSGRVEFWVYEDMKQPADPKVRRVGPRWGLKQADGRVLAIGRFFAPYLSGDRTYAVSESADGKAWFSQVTYLGECRRAEGWQRWTFEMDAEKGLSLAMNGKDVNAARPRYDWGKSSFGGFTSVVFYGDAGGAEGGPVWIDDLKVELGGQMVAVPTPPPPPPPVVPERDPEPRQATPLAYGDLSVHPRLLFGPEDVVALREFAASPAGKPHFDRIVGYLGASRAGAGTEFLTDATDGQRQGLWRLPTVALHYVLKGDGQSRDRATEFLKKFNDLPHWETGAERDSGMSAANIMIGAALAFDWLYNDLDPAFRETFRRKLWHHARAMYHGGHLRKNAGTHYWQNDPQNNHRWHRDAGMVLCALAAATGSPDEQWLLGEILAEIDFIARWLPADGTSHESSSYLVFGGPHLTLALQAADRGFGKDYLSLPFFASAGYSRLHSLLPGFKDAFSYGDGAGLGSYNNFHIKAASRHRQSDVLAGLARYREAAPKAFEYGWFDVLWTDPEVPEGRLENLPAAAVFPDIGTLFVRDGWGSDAVAAMFKSCPLGGHTLNRYRNENDFSYINVAHDDPDANSFLIAVGPRVLAETDRYSKTKKSANHNTVLVNGVGQESSGRAEGGGWTQPATGRTDMSAMAYLTAWKKDEGIVAIEGEAAGSYLALNDNRRKVQRPALERFRRTFLWVEGDYILVLDDLKAPSDVTFDWLMQGPKLEPVVQEDLRFRLVNDDAACLFQVASEVPLETAIRTSSADHRGKPLGWQQLVATAKTSRMRVASVYAPWGGDARVSLAILSPTAATITVQRGAEADVWTWEAAASATTGSTLNLEAGSRRTFSLTPEDTAPDPEGPAVW